MLQCFNTMFWVAYLNKTSSGLAHVVTLHLVNRQFPEGWSVKGSHFYEFLIFRSLEFVQYIEQI